MIFFLDAFDPQGIRKVMRGVDIFRLRVQWEGMPTILISGRLKRGLEGTGAARGIYFIRVSVF